VCRSFQGVLETSASSASTRSPPGSKQKKKLTGLKQWPK
jgi:hypothetical protein